MKAFFAKVWALVKMVAGKIAEFFENENGGMSSRRLFGGGLIVVSIVLAFQQSPTEIVLAFLGTGTTLIGLTTADKKQGV